MINKKSLLYLRYIDDIFLIWTGTKEELEKLMNHLNKIHPSIKFDYENSNKEINFLDTIVYKRGKSLQTRLYRKKSDRQNYLHHKSEHPKSLKDSIAYSQALRIKRICSEDDEFEHSINELQKKFEERDYNRTQIEHQLDRVRNKNRNDLLQQPLSTKRNNNKIQLITTYNRTLPNLHNAIEKHWHLLKINNEISKVFTEKPIIAYRRNKNIRDLIGSNTIENNKVKRKRKVNLNGSCSPCLSKYGNLCCKQVVPTKTFKSQQNGKSFKIQHRLTCHSANVIYLMECRMCSIYIYIYGMLRQITIQPNFCIGMLRPVDPTQFRTVKTILALIGWDVADALTIQPSFILGCCVLASIQPSCGNL